MALVPDNTLITATPEEGRELAIMMARKTIGAIQTDADVRAGLRPLYANDPNSLTAAGHVVVALPVSELRNDPRFDFCARVLDGHHKLDEQLLGTLLA